MDLLKVFQTGSRAYRLIGELDLSCLEQLRPLIALAASPGDIHLDLTRLNFMDGSAAQSMGTLAKRLKKDGFRLVVMRPPRPVERLLKRMAAAEKLDNLTISRMPSEVIQKSVAASEVPSDLSAVIVWDYPRRLFASS